MSGGQNNSRLTAITYPNLRALNYNCNTGIDTTNSRVSALADAAGTGAGTDEAYIYLGLDTIVQRTDGNGIDLSYFQQAGDSSYINDGRDRYTSLDRFGQVIDQYRSPSSSPTSPTDRFQLASPIRQTLPQRAGVRVLIDCRPPAVGPFGTPVLPGGRLS